MIEDNADEVLKYFSEEELEHLNQETLDLAESIEKHLEEYFGGALSSLDAAHVLDSIRLVSVKMNALSTFGAYIQNPNVRLADLIYGMEKNITEDARIIKNAASEMLFRKSEKLIQDFTNGQEF